jgi:hypothetical protein
MPLPFYLRCPKDVPVLRVVEESRFMNRPLMFAVWNMSFKPTIKSEWRSKSACCSVLIVRGSQSNFRISMPCRRSDLQLRD